MESFFASGPDEGEMFPIGGGLGTARVLGELPDAEAVELTFEPGWEGVAPHSHDDHTDSFYVLEGEVEFLVDDEWQRGGPGTYVSIPPRIVHGFRIAGGGRIRVLNIHTPKVGFVERLRPSYRARLANEPDSRSSRGSDPSAGPDDDGIGEPA